MKMKSLALVFCLVVSATAHPDYSDTWEEFKGKYGKEYADANEEVEILEKGKGDTITNILYSGLQTDCVVIQCWVHLLSQ